MNARQFLKVKQRFFVGVTILVLLGAGASLQAQTFDFTTSFEFNDSSGEFTRGTPPKTVTFSGGEAKTIAQTQLYRPGGTHSWMVAAGQTGTITFETPASRIRLFFRDQDSSAQSVLTFRDSSGQAVETRNGTTSFVEVELEDVSIKTITLENNSTSGSNSPYAVIDDFSFAAQVAPPDPAPTLLFPDFADGVAGDPPQNNSTRVILRNNDNSAVSGRVRFRNPAGELTQVSVGGQLVDTIDFNIAGFGLLDVETDGTGTFQVGSAEVLVDSGSGSDVEGTLIFSVLGNFVSVDAAAARTAQQAFVSRNSSENTGVAILNPDAETASMLELTLVQDGQAQASVQLEVQPGQQIVGFVNEASFFQAFFNANPGPFTGTLNIHVLSGPAVAVIGLVQKVASGALIAVSTSDKAFDPGNP